MGVVQIDDALVAVVFLLCCYWVALE